MNIFIGYSSALEFWRSDKVPPRISASRMKPSAGCVPSWKAVETLELQNLGICGSPVHLIVPDAKTRGRSKLLKCHVWNEPDSVRSFVFVAKGLYVSSSAAVIMQMATVLPLVKLIQLGYESCGSYALAPDLERGFRDREALTSTKELRFHVDALAGMDGCMKADKALCHIADGSASPMETILVMLLCLPSTLGGYGLPLPQLNHRIEISKTGKSVASKQFYVCDLYWPEAKLAVEYDSDLCHTGGGHITEDSKRRNALGFMDLFVVSATARQVFDAREVDKIARILAKRMGKRLRLTRPGVLTRRFELRSALLDDLSR